MLITFICSFFKIQRTFVESHITTEFNVECGWKWMKEGRESTMWIISMWGLPCSQFFCPNFPKRRLGLVRLTLNFGSWNTDTMIVASISQLCDWKGLERWLPTSLDHCPFWSYVFVKGIFSIANPHSNKLAMWISNAGNSLHEHMAHCPLHLPPNQTLFWAPIAYCIFFFCFIYYYL